MSSDEESETPQGSSSSYASTSMPRDAQPEHHLADNDEADLEGRRPPSVSRVLQFEDDLEDQGRPSTISYFETGIGRGPSRRDSQEWNDMVQQATKQADILKTPGRGGTHAPEFKARNKLMSNRVWIDGRAISVCKKPRDVTALSGRLYDKTKRSSLSPESLQAFQKSATGYVLPKGNKLISPALVDAEGHLKSINNLGVQLRLIERHLVEHDMIDVFTIVIPSGDVTKTGDVLEFVSLFAACPRLHASIIANSNTWCNLWTDAPYIGENLNFSYDMLRKNTDDDLWLKCQEDYDDYAPVQRGGPLMLFLILRRIQDVSESAIDHVKKSLMSLKMRDLPGEDVDKVVSLIKSAHALFKSASSSCHSFIPEDFPKMILEILQTSSVPEFNLAFQREQQIAQHKADKTGQLVEWPTISELTSMATNSYKRLTCSNNWCCDARHSQKALTAQPAGRHSNGQRPRLPPECWNCGGPHTLKDCTKPKDQTKIDAARQAFNKRKAARRRNGPKSNSNPRSPPRERALINGTPCLKNKLGNWVPDQRALRVQRDAHSDSSPREGTPSSTGSGDSNATPPRSTPRSVTFSGVARAPADRQPTPTAESTASGLHSALRNYAPRASSPL